MDLETYIVDIIEGRKKCLGLKVILSFLSLLFYVGCKIRNFCYDAGFFSIKKVNCPVVSVGNIVAGGTGKTPFVAMLASQMQDRSVAIVSRGYRSATGENALVSQGKGPLVSADVCGDEAFWLAMHTNAQVWIGKRRYSSAQKAVELGANLIILEDGFQHRNLQRDIEIVLLHAQDLFGKGHFLPRGYLRDLPARLSRADWIAVTYLEEENREEIADRIRRHSKAPIIGFAATYEQQQENLAREKVGVFCGIAKPQVFCSAVQKMGAKVVDTLITADHKAPTLERLKKFSLDCQRKGAKWLVCTEKDWVKLSHHETLALPVCVLRMHFTCVWNEEEWRRLCQNVRGLE